MNYIFNIQLCILFIVTMGHSTYGQMTFIHPGAMNNESDLNFIKAKIAAGEEPWKSKFNQVKALAIAGSNPLTYINSSTGDANVSKVDARKAYANALAWYYTDNVVYANQAIAILNAWSILQGFTAGNDQDKLQAGWIGALFGPAAEIMRGYSGWNPSDITNLQTMFTIAFYPQLNTASTWNGNVDLTQIDAIMSIAVFNEDETEFNLGLTRLANRNLSYFYLASDGGVASISGDGNNINTFWSNPSIWIDGLMQETCRDNGHHAQYALASALHAAEVAWNQGVDIYETNRIRYVFALELLAKQLNTGLMQGTCSNNTTTSSLFNTFEVGFNHYRNRMGYDLPNTESLINTRVRANGVSDWNIFYETLTHGNLPAVALGTNIIINTEQAINVFPNPFANSFHLTSNINSNIKIFNQIGVLLMEFSTSKDIVFGENLPNGIYHIVAINNDEKPFYKTIVKGN